MHNTQLFERFTTTEVQSLSQFVCKQQSSEKMKLQRKANTQFDKKLMTMDREIAMPTKQ